MIGDFGVPIAIFFMIAVDISISDAYTQVWQTLIIWRSLLLQVFSVKGSNSNYAIQASKRNGIIFIYLFCVIVWAVLVKIFQCFFYSGSQPCKCLLYTNWIFVLHFCWHLLWKSSTAVHSKRICPFEYTVHSTFFCIAFKSRVHTCMSIFKHYSQVQQ